MSVTIEKAIIPSIVQMLNNLSAFIDKAEAFSEARKIAPSVIINYRLAPDMFPFARQIQVATDQAKAVVSRLAGVEVPSYPDTEKTFAELKERIAKTIAYVKSIKPEQINDTQDKEIVLKFGEHETKLKGRQYVFNYFFPNFFFHVTSAYNILRHCGVELGKRDFLGG